MLLLVFLSPSDSRVIAVPGHASQQLSGATLPAVIVQIMASCSLGVGGTQSGLALLCPALWGCSLSRHARNVGFYQTPTINTNHLNFSSTC